MHSTLALPVPRNVSTNAMHMMTLRVQLIDLIGHRGHLGLIHRFSKARLGQFAVTRRQGPCET